MVTTIDRLVPLILIRRTRGRKPVARLYAVELDRELSEEQQKAVARSRSRMKDMTCVVIHLTEMNFMSGEKYILDTNVLIYSIDRQPRCVDKLPIFSSLTT